MSEHERASTPEEMTAFLGSLREPEPEPAEPEPAATPGSGDSEGGEPEPVDQAKAEIARWLLDNPTAADLLKGDTPNELVQNAIKLKQTIDALRAENVRRSMAAPDFEGGVRQTAPVPSDPVEDHSRLIADWLQRGRADGPAHGTWEAG